MISDDSWHVYIVRCSDGTLYTGITKDLERRITEHNSEKGGAKYTKPRRPVRFVYSEQAGSRSAAAQREYQIKKMKLKKKKELINTAGTFAGI
ncbi:MAG: GIY-YIG nuclease family protein [Thermodesulfobacteriota bacterium]|nr:GIY-YIG nuclease family protein [Thermodesulfobacteriota bacterium]